jgi:DNA-binding response OmpR family regulator
MVNTKSTILVADKSELIRDMLAEVLSDEGFAVISYPAEQVTPEAIMNEAPNLVILELRRRDADVTLLLLNQLRRQQTTKAIAILITSTDPALLDMLAALLIHLECATLIKPFALEELLECVTRALGRQPLTARQLGMD